MGIGRRIQIGLQQLKQLQLKQKTRRKEQQKQASKQLETWPYWENCEGGTSGNKKGENSKYLIVHFTVFSEPTTTINSFFQTRQC